MKKRFVNVIAMMILCMKVSAQSADLPTIEIGTLSTTHIIFNSDLSYVDISKQDVIAAKVVDASKNMLAIKAREAFEFVTTISALEKNGAMHTFMVKYNPFPDKLVVDTRQSAEPTENVQEPAVQPSPVPVEPVRESRKRDASSSSTTAPVPASAANPNAVYVTSEETSNFGKADAPTLEEIMKMPQQLYHIGDRCYKLEVYVTNIYVYSDLMYIVLKITNKSDIGYESGNAQFAVEDLNQRRQETATNRNISSTGSLGSLSCPPQGTTTICYTIPKLTLLRKECLKIYIYERKGTRNMFLTLTDKDINYAVSPR